MNNEIKLTALTLIGSVAVGALLLFLWDILYTATTGKPASERVRERVERLNRPLTSGRYHWTIVFYLAAAILFFFSISSDRDFRRYRWLAPLGWMISGGFGVYSTHKRWRKQQSDDVHYPSGGTT